MTQIEPHSPLADDIRLVFHQLGLHVGKINVANGWDTSRKMISGEIESNPLWEVAHKIAELGLIDTEVSEAIEEVRHGHAMDETYYVREVGITHAKEETTDREIWEDGELVGFRKPEGVPSELADAMIRIFDIADAYSINLADALIEKLNHNTTRGLHHGGKAL